MKRYTLAAVAALLVLVPWQRTARAVAPLYAVQNLGSFGGLVPTISGMNAAGQVVGNVSTNGSKAVRYTDGVGWQALPGLDTAYSVAMGINATGDVAGYHLTSAGVFRAFRFRDGFGVQDVDPLPGGSMTLGFAINDAGDVVGFSNSTAGFNPFLARIGYPTAPLPSLNGGFAYACGINTAGQVAGISTTPAGPQHAMRIDPGSTAPIDIQSPDGPTFNVTACAIDAAGRVGGQVDRATRATHAFRYTPATGVVDLDTFNSPLSNVESIAAGVSVGWYLRPDVTTHAFAHRDGDGSFDLNAQIDAPGWVLALAKAVNEAGAIAGEGRFNGAPAVFRLTPLEARDVTPPVIHSVTATPGAIWPPNHKMVAVSIAVSATDDVDAVPACSMTGITGAPAEDIVVTGPFSANVRASKNWNAALRTYVFSVACSDRAGNTSRASVSVNVSESGSPAQQKTDGTKF